MNSIAIAWLLIVGAGLNSCIGNLLLKKARIVAPDSDIFTMMFSPWFIGGLIFYAINVVLFAKALDALPVSIAYPALAGIGFTLLTAAAWWLYGEQLAAPQYLGIALVLFGIVLLARPA